MFQPVPPNPNFPQLEEQMLAFWKERRIYEQSLERRAGAPPFVFFEGPPTANGMPHPGHCLTRAIKDLFPRYRTMRGFRCERKAGWDTHGLPVEVEVCKELGIHSKEEIEQFGVEPFIHKCQASVWRYMKEWERLTERLGFWIHLDEAYVTYHQSFVESVWWSLKNLFDRGLLYQGHKIVWWWAQGGTALSSGEVGLGYREVADPSVFVRFPLLDEAGQLTDTSLLVWTTTPWTLPSNQFAAVHPDLEYVTARDTESGQRLILAAALVDAVAAKSKRELTVEGRCCGRELLGRRYQPPFDYFYSSLGTRQGRLKSGGTGHVAWRVVPASFVTVDSGTGVVHQAPAFGEVDYDVLIAEQARFADNEGPELINAVGPDGKFTDVAKDYAGRWVKEADKDISRELRHRGLLWHQEQYLHEYPFCWRAPEDPLIQYPRKSWFIRTTEFRDAMLANNARINWLPEHIRDGRFGNFLESNVDWALSRERYWGTPLPIWVCDRSGRMEAIASYAELLGKPGVQGTEVWAAAKRANPELPDDLCVHKPYIDAVTYDSPFESGGRMRRVPEVIDCWYDSGAMPFAQWGYPHTPESRERFAGQFPADFISEALDQTRGWFYSQLAISTMLFGGGKQEAGDGREDATSDLSPLASGLPRPAFPFPHPFRTCVVLGLMLAEWWESPDGKDRYLTEADAREKNAEKAVRRVGKMSKQLRNYRTPQYIFDNFGADALRWYFFANQAPWNSILYSERAIKDSIPEFLLRLWNCYSFFVIYASIDGFDPAPTSSSPSPRRPVAERSELDRWVVSELHRTIAAVTERMDAYDNFTACGAINAFVDALSNWYVRRSRDRFWSEDKSDPDKLDAYWTLYECLLTTCQVIAPFVPFLADTMWRNLAGGQQAGGSSGLPSSVHLCDFPASDATLIDAQLSARMQLLREIASLGRAARMESKLKVRQPLRKVEVILADTTHQPWLEAHDALLRDELNVKQAEYTKEADHYITYQVQPNYKRLGPRVGKAMPAVKKAVTEADAAQLLRSLNATGRVTLEAAGERFEFDSEDLQVRLQAKPGWAAAQGSQCVVVLSTELTPELIREGLARDLVRLVQERRKELNCKYTDRILVGVVTGDAELLQALSENETYIRAETLCDDLRRGKLPGVSGAEQELGAGTIRLFVETMPVRN